jgi:hypothetical protein
VNKEKTIDFYEMLGFALRHPWIIISSITAIMSLVFAQLDYMKLQYESQGIVSFEMVSKEESYSWGELRERSAKASAIIQRTLVRENIDKIIAEVWPDATEESNPGKYHYLRKMLRERNGIKISYDNKANFLTISFRHSKPQTCKKVVDATISALEEENRSRIREKIKLGLGFLREQALYYKGKINTIEDEIADVKATLKEKGKMLGERERLLISEITDEVDLKIVEQRTLLKFTKYDEQMLDLNMKLVEAEREKETLGGILKSGEFPENFLPINIRDLRNDTYIKEYSKMIAGKQLEIADLRSQGYLPAHPQIAKLEKEIESLKKLTNNRLKELERDNIIKLSEMARREAEDKVKVQIKDAEQEIETLKDKIDMIRKRYREESQAMGAAETPAMKEIATQATKINQLREEMKINENYYEDIRKQIEQTELKSRMEEAEAGVSVVVIERPIVPIEPIPFQKMQRLLIGFIFSIFVGVSISYIIESLDNSIRSASGLRELLNTPVLGSIDQINTIQEVKQKTFKRKAVIIGLVIFIILSRFIGKIFFA